jgi:DNA-binding cell septation regulator SpoVG
MQTNEQQPALQLTNVTLYPSKFSDSLIKAYGRIEINNALVIDVNVIDKGGDNQAFMSFPNRRKVTKQDGSETYVSPVYLKNKDEHKRFNDEVVAKYNREIKYSGGPTDTPSQEPAAAGSDLPF